MRLINTRTFQMEQFYGNIPRYAILSHTWEQGEVSFQDLQNLELAPKKQGYEKIINTCKQSRESGIDWCWVDTCCIDKSSSAELSEAINSMFAWYKGSEVCYVYLADVEDYYGLRPFDSDQYAMNQLCSSKWFTRGWTLQELLAPSKVVFFSHGWRLIDDKHTLSSIISKASGIEKDYINATRPIRDASAAKRMSWLSRRVTTRLEDIAYCLLGIFEINMPLLYGEGSRAFIRLQEEIVKKPTDQSLFCWTWRDDHMKDTWTSIFAPHPAVFVDSAHFYSAVSRTSQRIEPYHVTNEGLSISLPLIPIGGPGLVLAALQVHSENDPREQYSICIPLKEDRTYCRIRCPAVPFQIIHSFINWTYQIYISCGSDFNPQHSTEPANLPSNPPANPPALQSLKSPDNYGFLIVHKQKSHALGQELGIYYATRNARWSPEQGLLEFDFVNSSSVGYAIFQNAYSNSDDLVWFAVYPPGSKIAVGDKPSSRTRHRCRCDTLPVGGRDPWQILQEVELACKKSSKEDPDWAYWRVQAVLFGDLIVYSPSNMSVKNCRVAYISTQEKEIKPLTDLFVTSNMLPSRHHRAIEGEKRGEDKQMSRTEFGQHWTVDYRQAGVLLKHSASPTLCNSLGYIGHAKCTGRTTRTYQVDRMELAQYDHRYILDDDIYFPRFQNNGNLNYNEDDEYDENDDDD